MVSFYLVSLSSEVRIEGSCFGINLHQLPHPAADQHFSSALAPPPKPLLQLNPHPQETSSRSDQDLKVFLALIFEDPDAPWQPVQSPSITGTLSLLYFLSSMPLFFASLKFTDNLLYDLSLTSQTH